MAAACRVDRSQALPRNVLSLRGAEMQEEEVCQQQVCTCEHTAAVSPIAGMHYLLSGDVGGDSC